ncbi:hypothetical protein BOW53_11860 [Solemya pervernicosa gill symbiont]|uniref:Rhodanese domain-containing protein n=2 Tax=Gammaproteobacteria incertae sedis TaxID=118884 RepID=A0A1T2L2Q1_9GAMM|nr:rhodanese-like domain-containing protein [Candidatus Reidiella endopervernicosa]OOZ39344.1 hypothetical protein BOW53_11860 [Solemya pervernicosa gill symbiont]QKQ26522.1 rhodanese-like domain-containing protein [Candidatus Reidiella endopervernicosa]
MFFNISEIDATELANWSGDEAKNIRIIDVRESMEIAQGTIPGAEAMPMSTLGNRLGEIDQERTTVFICRSGARSGQVVSHLAQHGFENVHNLKGGVIGWSRSGFDFVQIAQTA